MTPERQQPRGREGRRLLAALRSGPVGPQDGDRVRVQLEGTVVDGHINVGEVRVPLALLAVEGVELLSVTR